MIFNEVPSANLKIKVFRGDSSNLDTEVNDWLKTANVVGSGH